MSENKRTFNTKIYEVCAKDKLRPIMECVYFKGGFMYASNGNAVLRQPLEWQTIINPENLEEVLLHKDSYKAIMNFDIAEVDDGGVACKNENGQEVYYDFYNPDDINVPDYAKLLSEPAHPEAQEFVGLPTESLTAIFKALHAPTGNIRVTFTGFDKYMVIDVVGLEGQRAIVMPVILNGVLFNS